MLIPGRECSFQIVCDPWPSAESYQVRLRVAHELAHTLFYDWSASPPQRRLEASDVEEAFCDSFAAALLDLSTE